MLKLAADHLSNSGGIRGILQLKILEVLEKETQLYVDIPIQQFFDLIIGTRYSHIIFLMDSSDLWT